MSVDYKASPANRADKLVVAADGNDRLDISSSVSYPPSYIQNNVGVKKLTCSYDSESDSETDSDDFTPEFNTCSRAKPVRTYRPPAIYKSNEANKSYEHESSATNRNFSNSNNFSISIASMICVCCIVFLTGIGAAICIGNNYYKNPANKTLTESTDHTIHKTNDIKYKSSSNDVKFEDASNRADKSKPLKESAKPEYSSFSAFKGTAEHHPSESSDSRHETPDEAAERRAKDKNGEGQNGQEQEEIVWENSPLVETGSKGKSAGKIKADDNKKSASNGISNKRIEASNEANALDTAFSKRQPGSANRQPIVENKTKLKLENLQMSLLKIFVTMRLIDNETPWAPFKGTENTFCSGFLLAVDVATNSQTGQKELVYSGMSDKDEKKHNDIKRTQVIVTNAHCTKNVDFLEVLRAGDPEARRFTAETVRIFDDVDLSFLRVIGTQKEKSTFNSITTPLELSFNPYKNDDLMVAGFPLGGETLNMTKGILGRLELKFNVHSKLETFLGEVDAHSAPGNSGGPVLSLDGKVAGVLNSILDTSSGFFIASSVLHNCLKAHVIDNKMYHIPELGITTEELKSASIKEFFGLEENTNGVLVRKIKAFSPLYRKIKENDIITKVNSFPVSKDGTVEFRTGERTHWHYAYKSICNIGDTIEIEFIRCNDKDRTTKPKPKKKMYLKKMNQKNVSELDKSESDTDNEIDIIDSQNQFLRYGPASENTCIIEKVGEESDKNLTYYKAKVKLTTHEDDIDTAKVIHYGLNPEYLIRGGLVFMTKVSYDGFFTIDNLIGNTDRKFHQPEKVILKQSRPSSLLKGMDVEKMVNCKVFSVNGIRIYSLYDMILAFEKPMRRKNLTAKTSDSDPMTNKTTNHEIVFESGKQIILPVDLYEKEHPKILKQMNLTEETSYHFRQHGMKDDHLVYRLKNGEMTAVNKLKKEEL